MLVFNADRLWRRQVPIAKQPEVVVIAELFNLFLVVRHIV
jgi:hypothetical protein